MSRPAQPGVYLKEIRKRLSFRYGRRPGW